MISGRNFYMAPPASVSTALLRNVPLFAGLDEDQLSVLARTVERRSFGRNAIINRFALYRH